LELSTNSSSHEIDKLKHKLQQMKQVLVTLSLDAPVVKVQKPSSIASSSPVISSPSSMQSLDHSQDQQTDRPPSSPIPSSQSPKRPPSKGQQSPIKAYREQLNAASVDFEHVLAQVFSSKETDSPVPIHHNDEKSSISLAEVDVRLAALDKEKKRLRKMLVTNIA